MYRGDFMGNKSKVVKLSDKQDNVINFLKELINDLESGKVETDNILVVTRNKDNDILYGSFNSGGKNTCSYKNTPA